MKDLIKLNNQDFDVLMVKRYPLIFSDYNKPMSETLIGFGCEVNRGWYNLLNSLFSELEGIAKLQLEGGENNYIKLSQVKEKFGSLRIYTRNYNKQVQDIINRYEKQSGKTCESCGSHGEIIGEGYVLCLCKKCEKVKHIR